MHFNLVLQATYSEINTIQCEINHNLFLCLDQKWPKDLQTLTIYNSEMEELPLINNSKINSLTILNWKNMKSISNIKALKNLQELSLSSNLALKELPNEVFKFNTNLKKLNFNKNSIKKLYPNTLIGLDNLEEISMGDNPIIDIPQGFFSNAGQG